MNQFKGSIIQTRQSLRWLGCVLALLLGYWAQAAQADQSQKYQYHYTLLWSDALPEASQFQFFPLAIDDKGRIYGPYYYTGSAVTHIAVYVNGTITVLPTDPNASYFAPSIGSDNLIVNSHGTFGGSITDPVNLITQAALFRGNSIEIIPFLPGETTTQVVSLNDSGTALLNTFRLYKKGKTLFSYQPPSPKSVSAVEVNNLGMVTGNIYENDPLGHHRGIRFQPPYHKPRILAPLPTDSYSFAFGINNLGYVLGMSNNNFLNDAKNHFGLWDLKGNFKTYFEDSAFNSSFALFNDSNLIVLTYGDGNSYLVPKPGVRFNLMDLVDNPTAVKGGFGEVHDINNRGDMVGSGMGPNGEFVFFLLRRVLTKD